MLPALWMGVSDEGLSTYPYWRAEARMRSQLLPRDPGASGIHVHDHGYGGESCLRVTLAGVFLPLALATDRGAAARLSELAAAFGPTALDHYFPDLDQLVVIRDALRATGPLDATSCFAQSALGRLTFAVDAEAYAWARQRFQPAAPDAPVGLRPWPADTFDGFAAALLPDRSGPMLRHEISGALLYATR